MIDIEQIYNQTPTPNESPLLVKEKLAQFALALDTINKEKAKACLLAKEKCPDECNDTFKLVFLRCEVFNVNQAVERWLKYWDARIRVFGEERAFLPMKDLGCFTGYDTAALRMEYIQVANKTDPDGRAILLLDFRKEACDIPSESLLRAIWHQVHVALRQESVQKRGVVVYVKSVDKFSEWRPSLGKKIAQSGRGILPIRFAGIHYVNPPTVIRIILPLAKALVGKKLRNRLYVHSGSTDEVLESLSRFGLGTKDKLPLLFGGNLVFR